MGAIVVIACASAVSAQTLYGTLLGNVTDDTGLAVPGATVKITHVETAQTREAPTNSTGSYNFPNIPTGTYQVDVTLTGFQSASSRNIIVRQNTSVRVDVRLAVGALQETVLVSGTAAVLQTESARCRCRRRASRSSTCPQRGARIRALLD
jgi:hypothetical protein